MAEHADSTEQIDDSAPEHPDAAGTPEEAEAETAEAAETSSPARFSLAKAAVTVTAVIVVALAGVVGWLGYRAFHFREAQAQRDLFVQVARQAAINLTTISYTEADTDIQRILDSATGGFHDDFEKRSGPFVAVVKQVQSKSVGTIAEAGLESESGDRAQVLVAVSVKTSLPAAPEQDPHRWRLRINVQDTPDGVKVSNVEFVP